MLRPVTVGLDGSRESLAAAEWAAREAVLRGLPLHLVHVWEWLPDAPPAIAEPVAQQNWAAGALREAGVTMERRHPGLLVSAQQVSGSAVKELLQAAADSEILVLGSRNLGRVAGFLTGSVSLAVLAHTTRPVILVRPGELPDDSNMTDADAASATWRPRPAVVLGLDLRQPSDAVIEFAFDCAKRRQAPLRVIHTWNFPPLYGFAASPQPEMDRELEAAERRALTAALSPWRDRFPDVAVEEKVLTGTAARHLLHAASQADLVVVGRRTAEAALGPHIGHVTHAVIHHAACPVAVVPHE
ncbi:universal stress protein [Streptomyces sp. NBC_00885]|uniref:universal stress protein n=1 Tax=Streptomyces sp. NBC_00885 TaxID=2975857 RepID=UPI00386FBDF9|nr:universal stress protein [Streptomyces sp. NBC_00885]